MFVGHDICELFTRTITMKSTLLIILCSFFVGLGCGYDPSFSETPFLCAQSGDLVLLVFPEEEKCPEGYTCDTETDFCVLNGIESQPQPQPEQPSDCPEGCFCGRIEMICP